MATQVYGASDDLIEFDGDVYGEVGYYGTCDDKDAGCLVTFIDGTVLCVKYGKPGDLAIWSVSVVNRGSLFDRIETCDDEEAERHSDTAHFKDGLKFAWAAQKWEKVH